MKWYQPIECDNTVRNPFVCESDNIEEYNFDQYSFKKGIIIDNWNDNIFLQAQEKRNDGKPDDALQNHLMIPIYSNKLVSELNKANIEGIQYLPVKILKPDGKCLEGFSIANFLNFIEAFDESKSNFNRFSDDFPNPNVRGKIAGVKKFVLKKNKLEGLDIIRLKEYNLRFFVSERVKNIFDKNHFTGYSFVEVELS